MGYSIELRAAGSDLQTSNVPFSLTHKAPPLSAEQREKNKPTICALRDINPLFEVFEAEAVQSLSDRTTGIQINFYSSAGAITVPFWPENSAPSVLEEIARYVNVIIESGHYTAYDPQTGREIKPREGSAVDAHVFEFGTSALKESRRRPWWKLW